MYNRKLCLLTIEHVEVDICPIDEAWVKKTTITKYIEKQLNNLVQTNELHIHYLYTGETCTYTLCNNISRLRTERQLKFVTSKEGDANQAFICILRTSLCLYYIDILDMVKPPVLSFVKKIIKNECRTDFKHVKFV